MSICLWAELQFVRLAADLSRTFFCRSSFFSLSTEYDLAAQWNECRNAEREKVCACGKPSERKRFWVATNNAICFYWQKIIWPKARKILPVSNQVLTTTELCGNRLFYKSSLYTHQNHKMVERERERKFDLALASACCVFVPLRLLLTEIQLKFIHRWNNKGWSLTLTLTVILLIMLI